MRRINRPGTWLWGFVAATALIFAATSIRYSGSRAMWADETGALRLSVRPPTATQLVVEGAPAQGSPSPLDYLLIKGLDNVRERVGYLGLPPLAYFRLPQLLVTLFVGMISVFLAWRLISASTSPTLVHAVILSAALTTYWFRFMAFHFSGEMRPYALWLAAYVVTAVSFFNWPRWRLVSGTGLVVLAATATASAFQLIAFALAFVAGNLMDKRPLRQILRDCVALFAVPSLIAIYYAARSTTWGYHEDAWGTWAGFLAFWLDKWPVPVLASAAIALSLTRPETRRFSMPALSVLFLYLLGPLIFFAARSRGMFFTQRQFLYYEAAVPVFLITVALSMRRYTELLKPRLNPFATVLVSLALVAVFSGPTMRDVKRIWLSPATGVPGDPLGTYAASIEKEVPKGFCFQDTVESAAQVETLVLVADWLSWRGRGQPVRDAWVIVEEGWRTPQFLSIDRRACAGRSVPVPIR